MHDLRHKTASGSRDESVEQIHVWLGHGLGVAVVGGDMAREPASAGPGPCAALLLKASGHILLRLAAAGCS